MAARAVHPDYSSNPLHAAVNSRDHAALRRILSALPKPPPAGTVHSEAESIKAEERAEEASAVLDNRNVAGRETPLHVAVKVKDAVAVELLMLSGADVSLQNEGGWTPLQEAVCAGEPALATIIMREYQTQAWAKWLRRLPRLSATMLRMRDFYMELTWHFESSVIPFIGRIAPSDTYRLWKRGPNLRADMSLAGFDGFRIQRAKQSILFLGEGSADKKHAPGSVLLLSHKEKEAMDALEGVGGPPSEADLAADVAAMFQTNVYRAGIDVTEATLVPQKTWRRNEKVESVGKWEAKVFDMHHVHLTFKSRKVPGAMSDEELFMGGEDEEGNSLEDDHQLESVLTPEEEKQLREALDNIGDGDASSEEKDVKVEFKDHNGVSGDARGGQAETSTSGSGGEDKKKGGWFGRWGKKSQAKKYEVARSEGSTTSDEFRPALSSPYCTPPSSAPSTPREGSSRRGSASVLTTTGGGESSAAEGGRESKQKGKGEKQKHSSKGHAQEMNEYSKSLRPTLWLTEDFPLSTAELLPLLDLLSPRVKAVRRLRELLTTKLPSGTFPVKVAIPVIPTIRVVVTFAKFKDRSKQKELVAPEESMAEAGVDNGKAQLGGWFSWVRGRKDTDEEEDESEESSSDEEDEGDVFAVPTDFKWLDLDERKRRSRERRKKQKGKKVAGKSEV